VIKLLFHSYDWTFRYFRFKPFFNLFEAHNHPLSERTLTYCPDDNYNNGVELRGCGSIYSWHGSRSTAVYLFSKPHHFLAGALRCTTLQSPGFTYPLPSGGTGPSAGHITGYSAEQFLWFSLASPQEMSNTGAKLKLATTDNFENII